MMKNFKIAIAVLLAIILSLGSTSSVFAAEQLQTINMPYQFPITPDDPEWKEFDKKEDMLAVCQIPEDILKQMTTEALLDTVLNYPFITDYFAFNNYEDAAKTFMNDFNGFRELYSRSDLTETLLAKYQSTNIVSNTTTVHNAAALYSSVFTVSNLEFLIGYDQILHEDYTATEAKQFDEMLSNKMKLRNQIGSLTSNSETYLNFMVQQNSIQPASKNTTVKTPKGTSVPVTIVSPDLSSVEKALLNSIFDNKYPKATRKSPATTNYNCHSYAWYSQSTGNRYWMNNPTAYMTDGSYKRSTDIRPRQGFKVYYYNADHSGVVNNIKVISGVQTFLYWSKWGSAGLYEHTVSYCPYSGGTRHYYKSAT